MEHGTERLDWVCGMEPRYGRRTLAIDGGASPRLGPGEAPPSHEPGVMAQRARPKLVVSSQRTGTPTEHLRIGYGAVRATVSDTPTEGAVTARVRSTGVVAKAFCTGE
jgi:competence protein ComEC